MALLGTSLSAMNAFSTGVHGAAYNIANMNTSAFRPVAVHYQSGPRENGVRPVVTREGSLPPSMVGASPLPPTPSANGPAAVQAIPAPSGTDPAREMVNLTINQRGFEANAAVIRTGDELLGVIIDLKV